MGRGQMPHPLNYQFMRQMEDLVLGSELERCSSPSPGATLGRAAHAPHLDNTVVLALMVQVGESLP